MKSSLLSILIVALLACGCVQRPDINVWGLTEANGALVRAGLSLDKADVGGEVAYANALNEVLMLGVYGIVEVGEPIAIPNPFPLTWLPTDFPAQGYIGVHGGWVDTLTQDSEFNRTRIFGGPIAGVKIAGTKNFALVAEYQYRLGEGGQDPLGDLQMESVVMFGAVLKFPKD